MFGQQTKSGRKMVGWILRGRWFWTYLKMRSFLKEGFGRKWSYCRSCSCYNFKLLKIENFVYLPILICDFGGKITKTLFCKIIWNFVNQTSWWFKFGPICKFGLLVHGGVLKSTNFYRSYVFSNFFWKSITFWHFLKYNFFVWSTDKLRPKNGGLSSEWWLVLEVLKNEVILEGRIW